MGLVSKMPSGPGVISEELIANIAKEIPSNISTFLLTSETEYEKIIEQHKRCNTTTIQLVDKIEYSNYSRIRKALPKIKIVQDVHVLVEEAIEEAKRVSKYVDFILLDSGNPNLNVKELGGTGKVHNWNISKRICTEVKIPIYLAGGLNSENIREAIELVKPYGVDLCTGVRTDNRLDEVKLNKFIKVVKTKSIK